MTGNREPKDVEARLRSALGAYADVVDDQPVSRPARTTAPRRSAGRGWRASVLAAAAALAVVGGTWAVLDGGGDPSTTAASGGGEARVLEGDAAGGSAPGSATDTAEEAQAGSAHESAVPLSELPRVEVGVEYPFDLYTHCGVLGADVGGVWFAADPPLIEEFGPPAGWRDPYQRGTLTLQASDEAVFRDDAGHEVRLRAAESERPPPCD